MRIVESKIPPNLLNEVSLPQCPRFREEAENIVTLARSIPPFSYKSMGEFQKRIIVEYWRYFDSLNQVLETRNRLNISQFILFQNWFTKKATNPENIRRAIQWLVNDAGILILDAKVVERAQGRGEEVRVGKEPPRGFLR